MACPCWCGRGGQRAEGGGDTASSSGPVCRSSSARHAHPVVCLAPSAHAISKSPCESARQYTRARLESREYTSCCAPLQRQPPCTESRSRQQPERAPARPHRSRACARPRTMLGRSVDVCPVGNPDAVSCNAAGTGTSGASQSGTSWHGRAGRSETSSGERPRKMRRQSAAHAQHFTCSHSWMQSLRCPPPAVASPLSPTWCECGLARARQCRQQQACSVHKGRLGTHD